MAETGAESLFELPVEEFTAARDRMAADLRKDGRRDEADRVKRLRRPTLAAWAVNQAVRSSPADVRELLEAGDQVRQAQRRALSGVRDARLTEANRARRARILQLADIAAGKLAEQGVDPEPHKDEIAATFEAASADPAMAEQLATAQLSKPLTPPSGFGDLAALTLVAGEDREAREQQPAEIPPAARTSATRKGSAEDARAAAARRRAEKALEGARRLGEQAASEEAAAQEARRAADEARREAQEASRAADEARRDAERLEKKADDLQMKARRLRARAADADEAARAAGEEATASGR